jgi:hypothetical protein
VCQSISGSQSICTKSSSSPKEISKEPEENKEFVVIQSISGASIATSIIASFLSLSSPSGVYQSINILQLFMMMLLLGIYLPVKVINIIIASSFFTLLLPISHIEEIYLIGRLLKFFDLEQRDSGLQKLGVEYESTFRNIFTQLLIV